MAYFTSVPPSALGCFTGDALKSALGRLMSSVMLRILVIDWPFSFAHIVTDTEIKKRVSRRRFSRLEARTQARGELKIVSINVCSGMPEKIWERMCDRRLSAQDGHLGWFREAGECTR